MIHYHGCPITPVDAALKILAARHACVSFAHPAQLPEVAEVCQSFVLDNGAFTHWKAGKGTIDVAEYAAWVSNWHCHPGFDWALIPDVIDGDERANDAMLTDWTLAYNGWQTSSVPVWHMHEDIGRLERLCGRFPRVALGSSGEFAEVGTESWWLRMADAMDAICDAEGRPAAKLHGLRMLDPTVFSHLPLASADSCNVARNIGMDCAWEKGPYQIRSKATRGHVIAERVESHASAARWNRESRGFRRNGELFG